MGNGVWVGVEIGDAVLTSSSIVGNGEGDGAGVDVAGDSVGVAVATSVFADAATCAPTVASIIGVWLGKADGGVGLAQAAKSIAKLIRVRGNPAFFLTSTRSTSLHAWTISEPVKGRLR